jgi:ATP-binding cassette subfamily B protein
MDFVIWLEAGRVRAIAPHRELLQEAEYRALFEPDDPSAAVAPIAALVAA